MLRFPLFFHLLHVAVLLFLEIDMIFCWTTHGLAWRSQYRHHVLLSKKGIFSTSSKSRPSIAMSPRESEIMNDKPETLMHPDQFGRIPMPANLSPSAVLEFKACPQSYLLQYLYKLRQPNSLATVKGSLCHEALEQVFDLDPPDRSLEVLQNLLRVNWGQQRFLEKNRILFEIEDNSTDANVGDNALAGTDDSKKIWDIQAEKEWGESALKLLQNYYEIEDPRAVSRPNPLRREVWLHSHLTVDPSLGRTVKQTSENIEKQQADVKPETFYIRGIVDRLDMVKDPNGGVALKIVDYKTGKAPTLKYTKPVNDRIVEDAFYQLKVYALLMKESQDEKFRSMDVRFLELRYLTSGEGRAKTLRYDLGETAEDRRVVLHDIHKDLSQVWLAISDLVALQDPKLFVGCDRSFCHCHKCRPRFVAGSLWEPEV